MDEQNIERLLNEIIRLTGESKKETVYKALEERLKLLTLESHRLISFLNDEIWPQIPADQLGIRLTKAEEDAILG